MSSKPFYKSQTVRNAIGAFLLATTPVVADAIQEGKLPNNENLLLVGGALYALYHTVEGRMKAKSGIQLAPTPEATPIAPAFSTQPAATIEPDFSAIETLPSEEYAIEEGNDGGELDVDLALKTGKYSVKAVRRTKIKNSVQDSSTLSDDDIFVLGKGRTFQIDAWSLAEANHIKVGIGTESFYLFVPDIEVYNLKGEEVALIKPTIDRDPGKIVTLPGHGKVGLNDPIYEGSHFTWREALRNGERMPYSSEQVEGIIAIARELDKIRALFGDRPVIITSWLRPDRPVDINAQVGGAHNSNHIRGHAVDFYISGISIWDVQDRMQSYWNKGGLGLGAKRGFVHLDLGVVRSWPY